MKWIYVTVLFALFSYQSLMSGGFQLNDHSARSVGMGFSTIANINDPSSLYYNPAAMVKTESVFCVSVGASYIMPGASFTGNTSLNQQITTNAEQWNFLIPHLYASWKTPVEGLSLGAGVFIPFGLGTRWDDDWSGRHTALETYLQTIEINPNIAYSFTLGEMPISVSAGFGYILGNVELKKKLDVFSPEPLLKLKGDGTGITFNFGLYTQPMENLKIGASYRHNIEVDYDGDVSYEDITGAEVLFQAGKGTTTINFPNDLKIGLAYRFMEELWIEAGINYVGWSSYDSLNIEFDKAPGNPAAAYTSRQARNYKDIITYRIAAEYMLDENFALRCGFYYEPMPVDADFIEPMLPEGNRFCPSLGIGYSFNKNFSLDLGYLSIIAEQSETKNNPNSLNGLYNSHANVLCLTFNYKY